jgi:hypothetical protein
VTAIIPLPSQSFPTPASHWHLAGYFLSISRELQLQPPREEGRGKKFQVPI